jgi:spore maturation protein CgeB
MVQRILYLEYHLVLNDAVECLRQKGHQLVGLAPQSLTVELFNHTCAQHQPDWVFSINFSPAIASLCGRLGLPYLSWTIDPLPSSRVQLLDGTQPALCLALAHDPHVVAQFENLGLPAQHILLAAPSQRRQPVTDAQALAPYQCDASFAGSSLVDELLSLDRMLTPLGGDNLSGQALSWAKTITDTCAQDTAYNGLASLGGWDALPPVLQKHCAALSDREQLMRLMDGALTAFYRQQTISRLKHWRGDMHVWGDAGWSAIHPGYKGFADHGDELTRIYCASAVNLDIPRLYQRQSVTMRVFDILAAGGFLLTEYNPALADVLVAGQHLAFYNASDDLTDILTDWVHRPDDRKAIAHAGRNEVMAKHLISHRVDTLLKLIDEQGWSH